MKKKSDELLFALSHSDACENMNELLERDMKYYRVVRSKIARKLLIDDNENVNATFKKSSNENNLSGDFFRITVIEIAVDNLFV